MNTDDKLAKHVATFLDNYTSWKYRRPVRNDMQVQELAAVIEEAAKVFTSKSGNTFLNIGAAYPNQTFTGWIPPASPVSKSPPLSGIEGKHVKITGRIGMYKGKPEIRINAASQLELE